MVDVAYKEEKNTNLLYHNYKVYLDLYEVTMY